MHSQLGGDADPYGRPENEDAHVAPGRVASPPMAANEKSMKSGRHRNLQHGAEDGEKDVSLRRRQRGAEMPSIVCEVGYEISTG